MSRLVGAIAGRFRSGEELVGTVRFEAEAPVLSLTGDNFEFTPEGEYNFWKLNPPELLLVGVLPTAQGSLKVAFEKPTLLLVPMPFALRVDHIGKAYPPELLLIGVVAWAGQPGLVPVPPVEISDLLVPTDPPAEVSLEPSTPIDDPWLLRPTTEKFM